MKRCLAILLLLGGCKTAPCPAPGVEIQYKTVTKEVMVPCKVTIPERPGALVVKPGDDANAVALREKALLDKWGGSGSSYANLAEAAIRACMNANKP